MLCSSFKFVIKMLCDLNGWFFLIIILKMEVGFCSLMSDLMAIMGIGNP